MSSSSLRQRPSSSIPDDHEPPSSSSFSFSSASLNPPQTQSSSALSQALESTAHLANLLPTGTLLAFQLLTPIFTNNGSCDAVTRPLTLLLLLLLSLSCFLASFTDSVRASDGQLYYGFATFKGLWLFDNYSARTRSTSPAASVSDDGLPDLTKYRVAFIDVVHAVLSVMVFGAVALRDRNVVRCFYPAPGEEVQEVLDIVPVGIGLLSSFLFVVFPSKRHGIGYPVTPADQRSI